MAVADDESTQRLMTALDRGRAILVAGAGLSRFAGYPLWDEFVQELADQAGVEARPEGCTAMQYADVVKGAFQDSGRIEDYYNAITSRFKPPAGGCSNEVNTALVQLGFCGLATTNYDILLELAVRSARATRDRPSIVCEPLDLCNPEKYEIREYLQNLSPTKVPARVLHIHGVYSAAKRVVFTENDYLEKYGDRPESDGRDGAARGRIEMDKIHRRLLWALAATHSLVFVGFSLKDQFFTQMLQVAQSDFQCGSTPYHFAFLPMEEGAKLESLPWQGVQAIHYDLSPAGEGQPRSHEALRSRIIDIASARGITSKSAPAFDALAKDLLKRR